VILSDGEIVDQAVARALPLLSHPQMLAATHQAKKQVYAPSSTIVSQGEPVDHFFMVAEGEVEIVLQNSKYEEMSLARLGPGQFFGEVELTQGGNSIASVRAVAEGPVELAILPKEEFLRLIAASTSTRQALGEVAQSRFAENRSARERDC
jgi:CRP-like cAMP-binding protein